VIPAITVVVTAIGLGDAALSAGVTDISDAISAGTHDGYSVAVLLVGPTRVVHYEPGGVALVQSNSAFAAETGAFSTGMDLWLAVPRESVGDNQPLVLRAADGRLNTLTPDVAGCDPYPNCDFGVRALAVERHGAWVGGWYGVHSSEVAYAPWLAWMPANDSDKQSTIEPGRPRQATIELAAPAFESEILFLSPGAGVISLGRSRSPGERPRYWLAGSSYRGSSVGWHHSVQDIEPPRPSLQPAALVADYDSSRVVWRDEAGGLWASRYPNPGALLVTVRSSTLSDHSAAVGRKGHSAVSLPAGVRVDRVLPLGAEFLVLGTRRGEPWTARLIIKP
jgi:hypothetical protein